MTCSPEEFVRAWQSSSSYAEVTALTGMSSHCAACRACSYRKKGIPLKKFGKGRKKLDTAALTALANKCAKKTRGNQGKSGG